MADRYWRQIANAVWMREGVKPDKFDYVYHDTEHIYVAYELRKYEEPNIIKMFGSIVFSSTNPDEILKNVDVVKQKISRHW